MTTLTEFFKNWQPGEPTPQYIINDEEKIIPFSFNLGKVFYDAPWQIATEEQQTAFLVTNAKTEKIAESKAVRDTFLYAGYQYDGIIFCETWSKAIAYSENALVEASDGKNYRSLADNNLGFDPASYPEYWEQYEPKFRMTSDVLLNLKVKCLVDPVSSARYKFYAKSFPDGSRAQIDFGDNTGWTTFLKYITTEEDRVMREYNDYRTQIAKCASVGAVEAIVIDYSS